MSPVEYVPVADTLADVALLDTANSSLRTTTSILLGLFVITSFVLNLLLLSTVLSSKKLRAMVLYLLFCNLALLNLIETFGGMFVSLLFVSNGVWMFGNVLCRINACVQQFFQMETLMALMVMAVERAITLFFPHRPTFTHGRTLLVVVGLWIISLCFAIPVLTTSAIPVKPYKFRYVCDVDNNSPILYPIAQLIAYGGCLFVTFICFGALLSKGNQDKARSLPAKPHEYSEFIKRSRALQDHLALAKLILLLTIANIVISGPYIFLSFFTEIRNSREILEYNEPYEVPQDVDTILNWLKYIYPFLCPLLIFYSCGDIWEKVQYLVNCRGPKMVAIGRWSNDRGSSCADLEDSNVMTLVATANGLHLRLPNQAPTGQNVNSFERLETPAGTSKNVEDSDEVCDSPAKKRTMFNQQEASNVPKKPSKIPRRTENPAKQSL